MIKMWKRPKLASSLWGGIQLAVGLVIVLVLNYHLQLSFDTFFLFAGFVAWGVVRAVILENKERKRSSTGPAS